MKIILAIFCGLMVLFAGGCALILLAEGSTSGGIAGTAPLALIPGAVAVLNVLVLLALYGKGAPRRWPFYVLSAVDVVAALALGAVWASVSAQAPDTAVIAVPLIGALLLKAVLTVRVARGLGGPTGA